MDIAKIIKVLVENCPNETVAAFIATYGVFLIALLLVVVAIVKAIKKINGNKNASDVEIKAIKDEARTEINAIKKDAALVATNQSKVTEEIKNEIRANNDATMQLLISFGLALGVSYTDIQNTIAKAKDIYNVSTEQYRALEQSVQDKLAEEVKAEQEAIEEAKLKAEESAKYVDGLVAIKI